MSNAPFHRPSLPPSATTLSLVSGPTIVKAKIPTESTPREPTSLADLVAELEYQESLEMPDLTLSLSRLRMTPGGLIEVPNYGALRTTEWSRAQISKLLGVNWARWFRNTDGGEMAEEVNRRFERTTALVSVRSKQLASNEPMTPGSEVGVLRALLRPGYVPISDAAFARFLQAYLARQGIVPRVLRYNVTDKSTTYILALGDRVVAEDPKVGDLFPAICVRNSGVGFATFSVSAHMVRLVCSNGMLVPVDGKDDLFRLRHKGLDETRLRATLEKAFQSVPKILAEIPGMLVQARTWPVENVTRTIDSVLQENNLPLRLAKGIREAYEVEPEPTVFGIVSAFTRAAQLESPEARHELETVAGVYLRSSARNAC